jgi:hypothetical protein
LTERNSINEDAIASLSDQLSKVMQEIEKYKKKESESNNLHSLTLVTFLTGTTIVLDKYYIHSLEIEVFVTIGNKFLILIILLPNVINYILRR